MLNDKGLKHGGGFLLTSRDKHAAVLLLAYVDMYPSLVNFCCSNYRI